NLIYRGGRGGPAMAKRFQLGGITRDKQYGLTRGAALSKVLYLETQPVGKPDKLVVHLVPQPRIKTEVSWNFDDVPVRPRGTKGVIVTKHGVKKVERVKKKG